jgi:hypothetical protein
MLKDYRLRVYGGISRMVTGCRLGEEVERKERSVEASTVRERTNSDWKL